MHDPRVMFGLGVAYATFYDGHLDLTRDSTKEKNIDIWLR